MKLLPLSVYWKKSRDINFFASVRRNEAMLDSGKQRLYQSFQPLKKGRKIITQRTSPGELYSVYHS